MVEWEEKVHSVEIINHENCCSFYDVRINREHTILTLVTSEGIS